MGDQHFGKIRRRGGETSVPPSSNDRLAPQRERKSVKLLDGQTSMFPPGPRPIPTAAGADRPRPSLDEMMARVAREVAARGTCPRLHTGCVVTDEVGHILVTGYNGAPYGFPHCSDAGCSMEGSHCVRAIHAEANAICQAAFVGAKLRGGTLYCTHRPCNRCALLIVQAGIRRVVFPSGSYKSDPELVTLDAFARAGIVVDVSFAIPEVKVDISGTVSVTKFGPSGTMFEVKERRVAREDRRHSGRFESDRRSSDRPPGEEVEG